MSSLSEYLYADEKRLNAYVEQIRSPITFDKIPQWSVELSITGPKAGGSQAKHIRPLTTHEKIDILVDYLRKKDELSEHRPELVGRDSVFCLETCEAVRVVIPFSVLLPSDNSSDISLWISPANWLETQSCHHPPGSLVLIEDYNQDDDRPWNKWSGYSALKLFAADLQSRSRIISDKFGSQFDFPYKDPLELIKELDLQIGARRSITVLYRIRATGMPCSDVRWLHPDISQLFKRVETYAYPIFIAEAEWHKSSGGGSSEDTVGESNPSYK